MFTRLLVLILFYSQTSMAADTSYSREFDGSDVSAWFFGPAKSTEEKKTMALNIGRIGVRFKPSLNCGKISFDASVTGGIADIQGQFSSIVSGVKGMLLDTRSISLAVICYMQKNICSHVRNFAAVLQRELEFQFNACKSVDSLLTSDKTKNQNRLKSEAIQSCINSPKIMTTKTILGVKKRRLESDGEQMTRCRKDSKSKSKNLLAPFSNSVATGEQDVLKSLLKVVEKDENYDIWTKLLGETKLSLKGDFHSFYPNDFLKPEDFAHNIEVSSRKTSCDISKLERIINKQAPPSTEIFSKHLAVVIQEKLPNSIIFDLESLPPADLASACQALGDSLGALSLKKLTAEGRSDLSAALTNDALPKEIRILYQDRSDKTFSALEKRIAANEVRPLSENLAMIHKLAREYRKINTKEASGITARRAINRANKEECIDQLSCERGSR